MHLPAIKWNALVGKKFNDLQVFNEDAILIINGGLKIFGCVAIIANHHNVRPGGVGIDGLTPKDNGVDHSRCRNL